MSRQIQLCPGGALPAFFAAGLLVLALTGTSFGQYNLNIWEVWGNGAGTGTLIRGPNGTVVLFDEGGGANFATQLKLILDSEGISFIHYAIAGHYDIDHVGGLDNLVSLMPNGTDDFGAFYDRGGTLTQDGGLIPEQYSDDVYPSGKRATVKVYPEAQRTDIDLGGGATLRFLSVGAPDTTNTIYVRDGSSVSAGGSENNKSITALITYNGFDMYMGSDAEGTNQKAIDDVIVWDLYRYVDVMLVDHHGAENVNGNSINSLEFFQMMNPEVACISCWNNAHEHPRKTTVQNIQTVVDTGPLRQTILRIHPGDDTAPNDSWAPEDMAGCHTTNGHIKISTDGTFYTVTGNGITDGQLMDHLVDQGGGTDSDGDGLSDSYENGTYHAHSEVDWDGVPGVDHYTNPADDDTDNDGLKDGVEVLSFSTNPLDTDTDDDSFSDGDERAYWGDDWDTNYDSDGIANNLLDDDSDNDGLTDGDEIYTHGTDPAVTDSDIDGIGDGTEVNTYGTDPADNDSDDDSFNDGVERTYWGANWNTNYDGDGFANNLLDPDSDNDNLLDGVEYYTYGTDPADADSDGDLFEDADELDYWGSNWNTNYDGDGITNNLLDPDSDNDGIDDGPEFYDYGTGPPDSDSDDDSFNDGAELTYWGSNWDTNYDGDGFANNLLDPDSDNDGVNDGTEFYTYGSDPTDTDSDDDNLTDGDEVNTYSTNPMDTDSDDDTIADGTERTYWGSNWNTNYDGDGITNNLLDPDSDNDGLDDGAEVYTYSTNPAVKDSDGDGFWDGWEAANGFSPTNPADYCRIVINEVLYDPHDDYTGDYPYEFVELFNPHNRALDIGSFNIQVGGQSFSTEYTIPEGTSIPAHSYFLIGGSSVTDINGYSPDLTTNSLGLQNGDYTWCDTCPMREGYTDGVRVTTPYGAVLDTVLYSDPNDNGLPDDVSNPGYPPFVTDTAEDGGESIQRTYTGEDTNSTADWTSPVYPPAPACSVYSRADFDLDGDVDENDRTALINDWGTARVLTDINFDGVVDDADLGILINDLDDTGVDTDEDGITDYDEVNYDGDPEYNPYDYSENPTGTDPDVDKADTDEDGFSDYIEVNSGSNPADLGEGPASIRINYQPGGSEIPEGYMPDCVGSYSSRGYGW